MRTYRIGIIGLSGIAAGGPARAASPAMGGLPPGSHAAAYDRFPQCEVVAAADPDPARREAFEREWGTRWPRVRLYERGEEMLAAEPLDLASVATADHLHTPFVLQACQAGVKVILCEKPLATSLHECDQIIHAVEEAGVALVVDHTRRWLGSWQDAFAEVQAGTIGELRHVVSFLGGPRAMLFRNGTHLVDVINWFAQSDPVWVSAEVEQGYEAFAEGYRGDGGHDAASEPGANGSIAYANGVRGTLVGMKGTLADNGAILLGSAGRICIDGGGETVTLATPHGLLSRPLQYSQGPTRREYQYPAIAGAVRELLLAVEGEAPPSSSAHEARKAVAILLAMLRSHARNGARVAVPGVGEEFRDE